MNLNQVSILLDKRKETDNYAKKLSSKDILNEIMASDPTAPKYELSNWILKSYLNNNIKSVNQFKSIGKALYVLYKNNVNLTNVKTLKDIHNYILELHNNINNEKFFKQSDILYSGNEGTILIPKTEEAYNYFKRRSAWMSYHDIITNSDILFFCIILAKEQEYLFTLYNELNVPYFYDKMTNDIKRSDLLKNGWIYDTLSRYIDKHSNLPLYNFYFKYGYHTNEEEEVIKTNPRTAYLYTLIYKKKPWPAAEPYIIKNPKYAALYAIKIIGERWYAAENVIKRNKKYLDLYNKHFGIVG